MALDPAVQPASMAPNDCNIPRSPGSDGISSAHDGSPVANDLVSVEPAAGSPVARGRTQAEDVIVLVRGRAAGSFDGTTDPPPSSHYGKRKHSEKPHLEKYTTALLSSKEQQKEPDVTGGNQDSDDPTWSTTPNKRVS